MTALVQELRAWTLQGARRVRDARLGRGAGGARPQTARSRRRRRHARRRAQGEGRHRRGPRRHGSPTLLARALAADDARCRTCSTTCSSSAGCCGASASTSTSGRMLDVAEALQHVDLGARDEVYHTCRTLLVHRQDDLAIFDAPSTRSGALHRASRRAAVEADRATPGSRRRSRACRAGMQIAMQARRRRRATGRRSTLQTWSDAAALADKDFARVHADEIALARAALDRLVWNPGERRTRRWVPGAGPRIDLRRALARQPAHRRRRRRSCRGAGAACGRGRSCCSATSAARWSATRACCCTSRMRSTRRHRRVEAFLFSTRLTRITTRAARARGSTRRSPRCRGRCPTGRAARGSARRSEQFHQRWRAACCTAARSCC